LVVFPDAVVVHPTGKTTGTFSRSASAAVISLSAASRGAARENDWHLSPHQRCAQLLRPADGTRAYVGYGVDSITVALAAISRVKFLGETREAVAESYPTAEDARITVAIVHAAAIVRDLNFKYLNEGKGAPVTARFGADGITIVDPHRAADGADKVFQRIYAHPV
jgi:hypothetical protein